MAHNSVSGYENGKTELDPEMREKFAKALEVSMEEIKEEEEGFARWSEDSLPYRVSSIAINLLPSELLKLIIKCFSDLLPASAEPDTGAIMHSLFSLTEEVKRRGADEVILHHQQKPKPISSGVPSEAVSILNEQMKGIVAGPAGGEESGQQRGAGAPSSHKPSQRYPSGKGTKAPRAGRGAKDQT